eukprot:3398814-Prorocentrum_lima.AAC.1
MTSSLVGSEMCIRDSLAFIREIFSATAMLSRTSKFSATTRLFAATMFSRCLLYTSDAADDM